MTNLDIQILATLAYSKQFEFALKVNEITERLFSARFLSTTKFSSFFFKNKQLLTNPSALDIKARLQKLVEAGLIKVENDFYNLRIEKSSNKNAEYLDARSLKSKRDFHHQQSAKLKQSLTPLLQFLLSISWIKAVGLTGSVAMDSAILNDDLDFIVITQKNRVWVTRLLVLAYSLLLGKKKIKLGMRVKKSADQKKDNWCFNLWLSEDDLVISKEKRSLYSAHELKHVKWLFDHSCQIQQIYLKNNWINQYFDGSKENNTLPKHLLASLKDDNNDKFLFSYLLDKIDQVVFFIFRLHLLKATNIYSGNLNYSQAFLHDNSSYIKYLCDWKKIFWASIEKLSQIELDSLILSYKKHNKAIGLVTGVFDLLHQGHVSFLTKARMRMNELDGCLLVGVESDVRVKQLKGDGRPIEHQSQRIINLITLQLADMVFLLPKKFDKLANREKFIKKISPKLLLVSSHTPNISEKTNIMKRFGGELEVISQQDQRFSTTKKLSQNQPQAQQQNI